MAISRQMSVEARALISNRANSVLSRLVDTQWGLVVLLFALFAAGCSKDPSPVFDRLLDEGLALAQEGKLREASERYQHAIQLADRYFKNKGPRTATALAALAEAQSLMAYYSEADSLFEESIRIFDDVWTLDTASYDVTLIKGFKHFQRRGNYTRATELLHRLWELRALVDGAASLRVAEVAAALGGSYDNLDNLDSAVACFRRAGEIAANSPTWGADQRAYVLMSLVDSYLELGETGAAGSICNTDLAALAKDGSLSQENRDYIVYLNLKLLMKIGERAKAISVARGRISEIGDSTEFAVGYIVDLNLLIASDYSEQALPESTRVFLARAVNGVRTLQENYGGNATGRLFKISQLSSEIGDFEIAQTLGREVTTAIVSGEVLSPKEIAQAYSMLIECELREGRVESARLTLAEGVRQLNKRLPDTEESLNTFRARFDKRL